MAIGTFIAMMYCFFFYVVYLSKNFCKRPLYLLIKRIIINVLNLAIIVIPISVIAQKIDITIFFVWILCGCFVTAYAVIVTLLINTLIYKNDTKMAGKLLSR